MKEISPEFSYIVDVRQIPLNGLSVNLTANAFECKALASRFGIPAVKSFNVQATLKKINKDRIRMHADIKAEVEQMCVVSLTPFLQEVRDSFNVIFSQEKDPSLKLNEIDLNADDEDDDYGFDGEPSDFDFDDDFKSE